MRKFIPRIECMIPTLSISNQEQVTSKGRISERRSKNDRVCPGMVLLSLVICSLFSFLICLGCWRVYVVLQVLSTMQ